MPSGNAIFRIYRHLVLGLAYTGSIVVLIMGALVMWFTNNFTQNYYFPYAALGIAVASLTIITFPVMLLFSTFQKGFIVNIVFTEIVWLGLLSILWLAAGATTASQSWLNYCKVPDSYPSVIGVPINGFCMETQVMAGFSFINWAGVTSLWTILLFLTILQTMRGNNNIWTEPVTQVDFFAPAKAPQVPFKSNVPISPGIAQYVYQVPQQHTQHFSGLAGQATYSPPLQPLRYSPQQQQLQYNPPQPLQYAFQQPQHDPSQHQLQYVPQQPHPSPPLLQPQHVPEQLQDLPQSAQV